MPLAVLTNASLHYRLEGPEGAPALVLSNSLGTEMAMWDGQMGGLTEAFRVLRYDTRGHGRSTAAGDAYSLDDLGGDVLELLDLLGIGRFHVCGVSLGGMTALWLAIHAPQRVLGLMPCNTAARIGSEASWNARIEQVAAHGMAGIADATMERWFTPAFRQRDAVRVETTRQMLLGTSPKGYMACCAALRGADLTSDLASIASATLVISGADDPVTPPADGLFLQSAISGAKYRELSASHLSNVEQPEAFLQAMLDFFQAN